MFRVVTEFVKVPAFILVCDHPHCGVFESLEVNDTSKMVETQQAFLHTRLLEGWAIGLDGQICPGHMQKARQSQSRIAMPKLIVPN